MSFKPNFCTIIKCSHHFVVKNPTPQITQAIYNLSSQYTQCGLEFDKIRKKKVWRPLKTYAIYVDHGHEFRFHIGQFREFFDLLNSNFIDPNSYEIFEKPMYEAADAEFKIREGWELYPEQAAAVEFATDPIDGNNAPLIMMPTGTGKGVTSMFAVAKMGKRLAVLVLSGYVKKWVKELREIYSAYTKNLMDI